MLCLELLVSRDCVSVERISGELYGRREIYFVSPRRFHDWDSRTATKSASASLGIRSVPEQVQ